MFATLPEAVTKTLNIVQPRPSQVEVIELDEDGNVTRKPYLPAVITSSYAHWSLQFSVAVWDDPKLGTKQCRPEMNGSRKLQTVLNKRSVAKSVLETGAGKGANDMNKCTLDKTEPAVSSSQS